MKVLQVKRGQVIARKKDKVKQWYLIQEGAVVQKYQFQKIVLQKNAIVGLLETEWFMFDYYAAVDTTLIEIPCKNSESLMEILSDHPNYRLLFLKTAIEQRHQALQVYQQLEEKVGLFRAFSDSMYAEYQTYTQQYVMPSHTFERLENLEPLTLKNQAYNWEVNNSTILLRYYFKDYLALMVKNDAMCVAAILEVANQMRRIMRGIMEMIDYLYYNRDVLVADSENDLFHLYFDMAVLLARQGQDISPIMQQMTRITDVLEQLNILEKDQLQQLKESAVNYDFSNLSQERVDITKVDCMSEILTYAHFEKEEIANAKEALKQYRALGANVDYNESFRVRKQMSLLFYKAYHNAFFRSITEKEKLSPMILMFLNFGFMDVDFLGSENAIALSNLTDHLSMFHSDHVFTIYEWLKQIYAGRQEPSRNELDMDYNAHLVDLKKRGEVTDEQIRKLKVDTVKKVEFEITNLFQTGHKITSGKVTTFCPILNGEDFINTAEKLMITAERLEQAMNQVREVDFSVLYREISFSDPAHGINQERIMKEVLPNFILMPTVGNRAIMWQETAGVKSDTPARILFPIFGVMDVDDQMIENLGRFRWEMCKHVQGVHWNDIRDRSLTSEYYDYIQFYKKNHDLSPEAKEKIKIALSKARNNFRDVFAMDYVNWIKYESKGGSRLNKVARNVMSSFCPFNRDIRMSLRSNPMYQAAFNKLDNEMNKKYTRLQALYDKYEQAGGVITAELKENMDYYTM